MATFTVTTLADTVDSGDGFISLREAIAAADATAGADIIEFSGPGTITNTVNFTLSSDLTIDGDITNSGTPDIIIDGSGLDLRPVTGLDSYEQLSIEYNLSGHAEITYGGDTILLYKIGSGLSETDFVI